VALCGEIVDLGRSHLLNQTNQVRAVGEITIVKMKSRITLMRILVQMIDPLSVKGGATTFESVDFIALTEEELREVAPILSRDASN
jgi:hypothetical protein